MSIDPNSMAGLFNAGIQKMVEDEKARQQKEEEEFESLKEFKRREIAEDIIQQTVYHIWDTYDCDGDDKLSPKEAQAFFKDALNCLVLKQSGTKEAPDIDLDLEEAVDTLNEDYWRLYAVFDPEFRVKNGDEHDDEYEGYLTKDSMVHFIKFLLSDEPIPKPNLVQLEQQEEELKKQNNEN